MKGREIHLVERPIGEPRATDFELLEREIPEPADGEVLVRNLFLSVDPYMRGRMNDVKSYVPPFALGQAMEGGAVGEVVATRSADLREGDTVLHQLGWREYAAGHASAFRRVDTEAVPASRYLGALGMPGLTAWAGIVEVAQMRQGETFYVSAAAGAVGSLAGQIARRRGAARVVGSAGSDEKVRLLTEELGFDAAFNHHAGPISRMLREAAPEGIDVYFDNVGGEHLEGAINAMRPHGRIAVCGMIAIYNATEPAPAPRNLQRIIEKRITMRGFLVMDHWSSFPAFASEVGPWLADGSVRAPETFVDGLENMPTAFIGLLRGENTGKMVVRLD